MLRLRRRLRPERLSPRRQHQSREAHPVQDVRPPSMLVSGLRSEHSNPSRSTLAGSSPNRLSVAPEIPSVQGRHRRHRACPGRRVGGLPLGPGETLRRRGVVRGRWDTAQGSGAHPPPRRPATRSRRQESRTLRPLVHFAARVCGASCSCETRFRLLWCCRLPFTNFSPSPDALRECRSPFIGLSEGVTGMSRRLQRSKWG